MASLREVGGYLHKQWIKLHWWKICARAFDSFSISAPAGLALMDSHLRVVRANDTIADMVGLPLEEILGGNPASIIPNIAPTVEPLLHSVVSSGAPCLNFPIEGETRAKPGINRRWRVSVFPIKSWRGFTGYIGAIVVELTDHVQLRLLAEAERIAKVGSWEWNLLTGEVTCSANLRLMLGLDPKKTRFCNRDFRELIHPGDRQTVRHLIRLGMRDKLQYEYQARFILPNGRERVFFTRGVPVVDSLRRGVRRIGVTQDITEQVESTRALLESEEKYRDLVENSHDLICTHDLEGRVTWMNELPAQILGYSRDHLIGHRIPELLAPETSDQFSEYIDQISRYGVATGVMQLIARSGERRYWEYRNTLRTHGTGSPIVRGVAHDITERKLAQKALRNLFETAKTLTRTLDLQDILDLLNLHAVTLIGAEGGCVGLRRGSEFSCDSFLDREGEFRMVNFTWPSGTGIPGRVLESKQVYLTNDAAHDEQVSPEIRKMLGLQNVLCVPVLDIPQRQILAFFALHNKPGGFIESDLQIAEGIATVAAIAIQNSLTHQRVCLKEDELHRLTGRLLTLQDDERRRIAHELHEQTAQDLVGIKVSLGLLRDSDSELMPADQNAVGVCLTLLHKVLTDIRSLSYGLHPHLLELANLRSTVLSYTEAFAERTGILIRADICGNVAKLPLEQDTALYRIVQEALENVRRHSETKTAMVRLVYENEQTILEVEDAGKGASLQPDQPTFGLGIIGMKERARQHGGSLEIRTTPGNGFKIRVQLPTKTGATRAASGSSS